MTRVLNLRTGLELWYSLPPLQAVYAAAMQYPRGELTPKHKKHRRLKVRELIGDSLTRTQIGAGNFNTWDYLGLEGRIIGRTAFCNDWAATVSA